MARNNGDGTKTIPAIQLKVGQIIVTSRGYEEIKVKQKPRTRLDGESIYTPRYGPGEGLRFSRRAKVRVLV